MGERHAQVAVAPPGMAIPNSQQKPRKALMRLVRVPIHRERMRCMPCRARAAGFHDDQAHIAVGKPAFKLGAGGVMGFNDFARRIGHRELKH